MRAPNLGKHTMGMGVVLFASLLFPGCINSLESEVDSHPARVTVDMEINTQSVQARLNKSIVKKIVVTLISSREDTLQDIITSKGSVLSRDPETFLPSSGTSTKVVRALYELAPNRTWKVSVRLLDTLGSVQQTDSVKLSGLKAFEYRTVSLSLLGDFNSFDALFDLPSEIRTHESGKGLVSRKVYFTHLNLVEGDVVKCDTSSAEHFQNGGLNKASAVLLTDSNVKNGIRNFTLNAYGYLEGDSDKTPRLLFKGVHTINASLSKGAPPVHMEWQATSAALTESEAVSPMVVKLGRVGTITMNAQVSGELEF